MHLFIIIIFNTNIHFIRMFQQLASSHGFPMASASESVNPFSAHVDKGVLNIWNYPTLHLKTAIPCAHSNNTTARVLQLVVSADSSSLCGITHDQCVVIWRVWDPRALSLGGIKALHRTPPSSIYGPSMSSLIR